MLYLWSRFFGIMGCLFVLYVLICGLYYGMLIYVAGI